MKISLVLLKTKNIGKKGFPIVVNLRDKFKSKRLTFGLYSFPSHWNEIDQYPTKLHPEYIHLLKRIVNLNVRIKEIEQNQITDFEEISQILKGVLNLKLQRKKEDFFLFTEDLIKEMNENDRLSNATVYKTSMVQLKKYKEKVLFSDFDYNFLIGFVNQKKMMGVKTTSIHNYLRTLRAIYNQAVLRKGIVDKKPFTSVFTGLKVRSHQSKKKYLLPNDIELLEKTKFTGLKDVVRDMFLLQFYLGGQDLKDIYYLENRYINSNRVYFKRSKVGNGHVFDLAITPKVKAILEKYNKDEYIFTYRKDYEGYKTFRRRYGRYLINIQKELNIEIKPLRGNLGIKVARHTFANIGKRLGLEEDILRELMGHERDDVDNYYKDKYPEKVRDEAQLKIINDKSN